MTRISASQKTEARRNPTVLLRICCCKSSSRRVRACSM